MITHEQIPMMLDNPVHDLNGEKIGEVAHVLLDDATGQPEWLCVKTGLLRTKETYVPLRDANLLDGRVQVPYEKDHVKNAPDVDVDPDGHLSPEQERELRRHYDLGWDAAWERANRPGLTGWADSAGRRERERLGVGEPPAGEPFGADYAATRRGERYGTDDPALGSRDRLDADIPAPPGERFGPGGPAIPPGYGTEDPAARSLERFETDEDKARPGERFGGDNPVTHPDPVTHEHVSDDNTLTRDPGRRRDSERGPGL